MKNCQMKVQFECDTCGHRFSRDSIRASPGDCVVVPEALCPRCNPPKLTYGPLTEEDVEAALLVAGSFGGRIYHGRKAQARFVLRLLDGLDKDDDLHRYPDVRNWRDWLLKLAREDPGLSVNPSINERG